MMGTKIILQEELLLANHMNYSEMGEDIWAFDRNDQICDKETCPALRLRLTYSWSDIKKFESLLDEWDRQI